MKNSKLKKWGILLLVFMFLIQYAQGSLLGVYAIENSNIKTVIDDSVVTGDANYFTYYGDNWVSAGQGSSSEHYNVLKNGESNPEKKYYTIDFIGNRIEVYGNKTPQNGKVKFSIFNDKGEVVPNSERIVDSRVDNTSPLYALGNLEEGKYKLKAEAIGINSNSSHAQAVIQVDRAEIMHNKYTVESINLGEDIKIIEGANKQLTPTFSPSYSQADDLVYSSDNEQVAIVSDKGLITGVSAGTTNIKVTSNEFNINTTVLVTVVESNPTIHGSIVDTNSHYTIDRYNEIMNIGVLSENLYGWKADKAISELVLASKDGAIKNLSVTASDFVSNEGVIDNDNVVATFIKETKAYIGNPGYHGYPNSSPSQTPNDDSLKKNTPDILYTTSPVNMGVNSVQSVWIEINIPESTNPGLYSGTLKVKGDNVDELTFDYKLEVLDATMPSSSDYEFDIELWQYPYSSAEYYEVEPFSKEHFDILTPIMTKYKELGGSAITTSIVEEAWGGQTYSKNEIRYPSMVKWTRKTDGTFTFDFTNFDKWVQFNKDLGIGDKIVCYSMIPWGNKITYYDEATLTNKSEVINAGTERYEEVWLQFLNKLVPHLDEKGWFNDTYIGIDERGNMDKAFDIVDKVYNKDGKVLKKSAAMDHFDESYKYITDRIDDLSVGSTAAKGTLDTFKSFVNERNESSKEYKTTIYTCTGHFPNSLALNMPGESYWIMMFAAAQGSTGYMRWAYDAWVADPLKDTTHWAFESGDTFLIYPDEKDSASRDIKSSVRLEKMAEGVRDVNKLYLMKKEFPTLKSDIDKLFEKVKVNYAGVNNGIGYYGGGKYATDETKSLLSSDMKSIKNEIKNITNKYIELRDGGVNTIESVSINEGSRTVFAGDTMQLTTKVLPENVTNKNVNWKSDNSNIVSVNNSGVITALKTGVAKITATSIIDETKTSTITVTVNKKSIEKEAQVAYYSFDDIDGETVKNNWITNNIYNGTLTGPEIIDGKSGKAIKFNSRNDKVVIGNPANIEWDWTVSFWVKRENNNGISSVMWDGREATGSDQRNSESIDLAVGVGGNSANAGVHVNSGTLSFKYVVPTGEWLHMAYTNSKANGLSLFVNGTKVGDTNIYTKTNLFKAPLKIIGGRGFVGELDEVKIYNRALTQEEVNEVKAINGLNLDVTYKEINVGDKFKINTNLVSNNEDKDIQFVSEDTKVATVEEDGTVTGAGYGDTNILVENKASGYLEKVKVRVNKPINLQNTLNSYDIDPSKQIVIDREEGQYIGQPDSILLDDDKTILTVYPKGHGFGEALLSKSTDGGLTWEKRVKTDETWKNSEETPTIYKLNFTNGSQKIISISGGPEWHGSTFRGYKTSISEDNGETWGEYKEWPSNIRTIVAMASLVQLKDENGNFIDKWMGVFHDHSFINYKTYLTFDEDGNEQWSDPVPYLSEYRDIESIAQICEVGIFRSPDGNRLVALARSQSHRHTSTIFYSDDEGETWSRPRYVQGSLNGERHKATYDPISGRLLISFREIKLDTKNDGSTSDNDWMAGDWIGWVGTYDDLMNGNEGQYRIILGKDYTKSARAGDTGYAGNVVMKDGTFFLNSYGNFDTKTNNNTYIMGVRFKLGEIDNALGLVKRNELEEAIRKVEEIDSSLYTEESYKNLMDKYESAKLIFESNESSQVQIDEVKIELLDTIDKLVKNDNEVNPPTDVFKKHLEIAVIEAKRITEDELLSVVPIVANEFKSALEEAEEFLKMLDVSQEQIDKSFDRLSRVMHMLSFKKGDKNALIELVEKINSLDENDYLQDRWDKLQVELENANTVIIDENSMDKEVFESYDRLLKAFLDIRLKPNKDKLKELINKVEKLVYSKYTEETWSKLQEELKVAKVVIANEKATDEEVLKSTEGLEQAINGLIEKKDSDNNNSEEKNSNDNNLSNDNETTAESDKSKNNKLPNTGVEGGLGVIGLSLVLVGVLAYKKRRL